MNTTRGRLPKANPIERRHHWLFGAKVSFTLPDSDGAVSLDVDTIITNTKKMVTGNMIGEAQQAVQMQVFEKVGDPGLRFANVGTTCVDYLGEMSREEFYTAPPAEMVPTANDAAAPLDPSDPFLPDATN